MEDLNLEKAAVARDVAEEAFKRAMEDLKREVERTNKILDSAGVV